jgi:hypothetical protein
MALDAPQTYRRARMNGRIMAKDTYAVWDFESGNVIYAYDTEE